MAGENNKVLFIFDIDDVVFPLGEAWLVKLIEDKYFTDKYKLINLLSKIDRSLLGVFNIRDEYYLNKFLKIDDSDFDRFMKHYTDDAKFYDALPLTKMGKWIGTIMETYKTSARYVFLTHIIGGMNTPCVISKEKRLKQMYNQPLYGYEIVMVTEPEGKQISIKNRFSDWDFIFEDRIDTIDSIINLVIDSNSKSKSDILRYRQIYVPWYGYNSVPLENTYKNSVDAGIGIEYIRDRYEGEQIILEEMPLFSYDEMCNVCESLIKEAEEK